MDKDKVYRLLFSNNRDDQVIGIRFLVDLPREDWPRSVSFGTEDYCMRARPGTIQDKEVTIVICKGFQFQLHMGGLWFNGRQDKNDWKKYSKEAPSKTTPYTEINLDER